MNNQSIKTRILNTIKNKDFIGIEPKLFVKRSERFSTLLGGLLCILIYIGIFISFLYFSQDLVYLKYPSENKSSIYSIFPSPILINSNTNKKLNLDLNINIVDQESYKSYINYFNLKLLVKTNVICFDNLDYNNTDSIKEYYNKFNEIYDNSNINSYELSKEYSIIMIQLICSNKYTNKYQKKISSKKLDKSKSVTIIREYKLIRCNNTLNFYNDFKTTTLDNNALCLPDIENNELDFNSNIISNLDFNKLFDQLSIYGNELYHINQSIIISIHKCLKSECPEDYNTFWDNLYKSSLNKDKTILNINNLKAVFYYNNILYDTKSYNEPSYIVPKVTNIQFNDSFNIKKTFYYNNIEINTDIGYVFEDFRIQNYISKEYENTDFLLLNDKDNISETTEIASLVFNISPVTKVIYRKYVKIQRILADVGGLFKTFVIFALIFNYFHNRASYYELLFNDLFTMEDLGKYFQYFDPNLRTNFVKYRDSIMLKNTRADILIKKIDSLNKKGNMYSNLSQGNCNKSESKLKDYASKSTLKSNNNQLNNLKMDNFYASLTKNNKVLNLRNKDNIKDYVNHNQISNEINNDSSDDLSNNLNNNSYIKNENSKSNIRLINDVNEDSKNLNNFISDKLSSISKSKDISNNNINIPVNNKSNEYKKINCKTKETKDISEKTDKNCKVANNAISNISIKNDKKSESAFNQEKGNLSSNTSSSSNSECSKNINNEERQLEEATIFYINKIRRDPKAIESFNSIKYKNFKLTTFEYFTFICCNRSKDAIRKKNILLGGKDMIEERMDIIFIMKKMLEFDRFKNLMLRDDQLLLLDSLSKFMLDPERINLVDIKNCNYDKFIDNYSSVFKSDNAVDITLAKWVRTKFQLKL